MKVIIKVGNEFPEYLSTKEAYAEIDDVYTKTIAAGEALELYLDKGEHKIIMYCNHLGSKAGSARKRFLVDATHETRIFYTPSENISEPGFLTIKEKEIETINASLKQEKSNNTGSKIKDEEKNKKDPPPKSRQMPDKKNFHNNQDVSQKSKNKSGQDINVSNKQSQTVQAMPAGNVVAAEVKPVSQAETVLEPIDNKSESAQAYFAEVTNSSVRLPENCKKRGVAIALAVFLGFYGAHKFYLRRPVQGIIYILLSAFATPFVTWIISLIEAFIYFGMDKVEFYQKYQ